MNTFIMCTVCVPMCCAAILLGRRFARQAACLFYSAFDPVQAEIISSGLGPAEWLLQKKLLLFADFFEQARRLQIAAHWSCVIAVMTAAASLFISKVFLMYASAACFIAAVSFAAYDCLRFTVEAPDGRRYHTYNAFAPFDTAHRNSIRREKQRMRLTALAQRIKVLQKDGKSSSADTGELSAIKERLSRI